MEIKILYIDLPCSIRGFVVKSLDAYTIFINSRLSIEQWKKTIEHEKQHILKNDFERENIDRIEKLRHF